MSFGDLLVAGATWALALGAAWATLVCGAAALEVLSSGRLALTARLGCPARARRVLLAGLGLLLAGGAAAVPGPASAGSSARDQLGLPVPARPTGTSPVRPSVPAQSVRVQPGDNLWRLSREHSRPSATEQDVARLVERTYRANRTVIGSDPDLIKPGQHLQIPRQRHDSASDSSPH